MSDVAHVIVWVRPEGRYTDTRIYGVLLGSEQEAEALVASLNDRAGYDDRDPEDGHWWGTHYDVETTAIWRKK